MCFQSCLTSDALNWVQSEPPNELRISRRERAAHENAKMPTISREAVGLHARVRRRIGLLDLCE